MNLLFLCTGNYYRSRYAEVRFNVLAEQRGLAWRADSRGLRVDHEQKHNVGPLSPDAKRRLTMMKLHTLDAATRMPRSVVAEDFASAQRVVAMQLDEHRPMMAEAWPDWVDRIEYWSVKDRPPGDDYDPMADIENRLEGLLDELTETPMRIGA